MAPQPHAYPIFAVLALAALSLAPVHRALAQSTPTPTPAVVQPGDPLTGPAVTDRDSPKAKALSGFGPDAIEKKKAAKGRPTRPMPMSEFLKALVVLRSSPSPLTSDQENTIKSIGADFETSAKAYMDKNKAEIETLRSQLTPTDRAMLDQQIARGGPIRLSKSGFGGKAAVARQNAKTPADTTTPATPSTTTTPSGGGDDAAKARTRLVEIFAGRPKADDAEAKILGVLNPDQLKLVQDELAKHESDQGKHKRAVRGAKPTT